MGDHELLTDTAADLLRFAGDTAFRTVLADPPWRFAHQTGKVSPEHRRLARYRTMATNEIGALPVARICAPTAHLYLWVPNTLLRHGLSVMSQWGFDYKTLIVWRATQTAVVTAATSLPLARFIATAVYVARRAKRRASPGKTRPA